MGMKIKVPSDIYQGKTNEVSITVIEFNLPFQAIFNSRVDTEVQTDIKRVRITYAGNRKDKKERE